MRFHRLACAVVLGLSTFGARADAQAHVTGTLRLVRTGWNSDSFAVVLNAPQQNPARCPNANGNADAGYVTDSAQPGYRTYYQAALAAYAARSTVVVVVDAANCVSGWPRIIGIDLPR